LIQSRVGVLGHFDVTHTPLGCCELLVEALDQAGEAAGVAGWVSLEGFTLTGATRHAFGLQEVLQGAFMPVSAGTRVSFELRFSRGRLPWVYLFNAAWPAAWVLWLVAVAAWLFGAIPFWQVILLAVANLVLGVMLRRVAARKPAAANPIQFVHTVLTTDGDEDLNRLVLNVIGIDPE
jgi:hypothetical protein